MRGGRGRDRKEGASRAARVGLEWSGGGGGVCSGGRWGTRVNQGKQGRGHSPKTPISPAERSGNIGRKRMKKTEVDGKKVLIQKPHMHIKIMQEVSERSNEKEKCVNQT